MTKSVPVPALPLLLFLLIAALLVPVPELGPIWSCPDCPESWGAQYAQLYAQLLRQPRLVRNLWQTGADWFEPDCGTIRYRPLSLVNLIRPVSTDTVWPSIYRPGRPSASSPAGY